MSSVWVDSMGDRGRQQQSGRISVTPSLDSVDVELQFLPERHQIRNNSSGTSGSGRTRATESSSFSNPYTGGSGGSGGGGSGGGGGGGAIHSRQTSYSSHHDATAPRAVRSRTSATGVTEPMSNTTLNTNDAADDGGGWSARFDPDLEGGKPTGGGATSPPPRPGNAERQQSNSTHGTGATGNTGFTGTTNQSGWGLHRPDFKSMSTFFRSDNRLQRAPSDDHISLSTYDSEEDADDTYWPDGPGQNAVLDDVDNIPGSPWARPSARHAGSSDRPSEPLAISKHASTLSFVLSIAWVVYQFVVATWQYTSFGRLVLEIFLAILTFFGIFWNSYFTVSSILKCFIPKSAFKYNTKYFSSIPEEKHKEDDWLSVTIQIPVYKESLSEVLGPTLISCMASRDHYMKHTGAECNIVVCDDGIMAHLKNNFSAAEMLWDNVEETNGEIADINVLLERVPRAARRHLKGLKNGAISEVFNRMRYYYRHQIGFVARSTIDRRGKFKKASNLNTHLRLVFGAQQILDETPNKTFEEALLEVAHNEYGSRDIMFGNNIRIGSLMIINDADARMQPPVIMKTVPEFLNDKTLGFTQHATKTMDDQRGESYYLNMVEAYTDALYQGHFLLSSIMGCHPPLVGHSVFLRSEAVRQCGRMRTLRKAQRWLNNIGLPFLGVEHAGIGNLQASNQTEYWSESHVSEDFELMIHLYNLGYMGRYVAYPGCEFQEGVSRNFDEEANRHRKFSLGAHELMFNPIQDVMAHGIYTNMFRTFLTCDIPSYYKLFLTAYLQSYMAGGIYLIVFITAAIVRLVNVEEEAGSIYLFSPAGVLVLNIVVYYVIGYTCFFIALARMHCINKDLFFPEYARRGILYLWWKTCRYALTFQVLFYSVMGNYFFLGAMDHLLSRSRLSGVTNKDSITIHPCTALKDTTRFNSSSYAIALGMGLLALATLWEETNYQMTSDMETYIPTFRSLLFAAPTLFMAIMALLVPIILNPHIWTWKCCSCFCGGSNKKAEESKPKKKKKTKAHHHQKQVPDPTMAAAANNNNKEVEMTPVIKPKPKPKNFSNSPPPSSSSKAKSNRSHYGEINVKKKSNPNASPLQQQQQQQQYSNGYINGADQQRRKSSKKKSSNRQPLVREPSSQATEV